MEQPFDQFLMFRNRLQKVFRHRSRAAARQGINVYRLYDHDLPQFPFIIEMYETRVYVSEYKRNHQMEEARHEAWLEGCSKVLAETVGVPLENIHIKLRKRKENRQDQYRKTGELGNEFIIQEAGLQFLVNLDDYLDTGFFPDHRITRAMVREESRGKRMLNLFCYTGSFSVYAAAGGAVAVVSVDLSKTYLEWARRNTELNMPGYTGASFVHADVKQFLKTVEPASYDLIVMDPPTFSNSKRMEDILDIQRDHAVLINQCLDALSPDGVLYFSTNFSKFRIDASAISGKIKDITRATTPFDFEGKLHRYCYRITH